MFEFLWYTSHYFKSNIVGLERFHREEMLLHNTRSIVVFMSLTRYTDNIFTEVKKKTI